MTVKIVRRVANKSATSGFNGIWEHYGTPTPTATMHIVTDGRTDRRTDIQTDGTTIG